MASTHADRGAQAWAGFLLGRAHSLSPRPALDEAALQLESALSLALAGGAAPLAAFCQTALGSIHDKRGNKTKAEELTAAAETIYKDLDMRALPLVPWQQEAVS
jgi:hypothetical protein